MRIQKREVKYIEIILIEATIEKLTSLRKNDLRLINDNKKY